MDEKQVKTLVVVAAFSAAVALVVLIIDYQIKNDILRLARRLQAEWGPHAGVVERVAVPTGVRGGDSLDNEPGIPSSPLVAPSSGNGRSNYTQAGHGIPVSEGPVSTGRFSPEDESVDADTDKS